MTDGGRKYPDLHVDAEGVLRGYYVYAHVDQATNVVFYVGKGSRERAWDTEDRNDVWRRRIAGLAAGWRVEILHDNLSEIEAFALEEKLVAAHGGPASYGGSLANWMPGGEEPVSIKIVSTGVSKEVLKAYYGARRYNLESRQEQESVASGLKATLQEIFDKIEELQERAEEHDDENLLDAIDNLETLTDTPLEAAKEFLKHRIAWKDFCVSIEWSTIDVDEPLTEKPLLSEAVQHLHARLSEAVRSVYARIDSGNEEEASRIALQATATKK